MSPDRRITWAPVTAPREIERPDVPPRPLSTAERAFLAAGVPTTAGAMTPREDAIGLLRLAAEVEHALLVQYLYAAASIDMSAGAESRNAHRRIITIGIQEMGHLIAVQNLLLALAGPDAHHLGRDGMRASSDRNPLPLVLERVSHAALAKYVTVERPDDIPDAVLKERVDALGIEAAADAQFTLHPVIALYNAIYWIVQPNDQPFGRMHPPAHLLRQGWHLKPQDFIDLATIDRFGSTADEWAGYPGLTVSVVHDAQEACDLLAWVMEQGEGGGSKPSESHFSGFLRVLDAFEANHVGVIRLCRSPRVSDQPVSEDQQATVIDLPYVERWARLFNLRYTELVLTIGHTLSLPIDDPNRASLSGIALTMMRPGLSDVMKHLTTLEVDSVGSAKAGPTFGLLDDTIPVEQSAFWARHAAYLAAQAALVTTITTSPEFSSDVDAPLVLQMLAPIDDALAALVRSVPVTDEGKDSMRYAIYPPTGLARIGNSTQGFIVGPERPGSLGTELLADGTEVEVTSFKDSAFRVKPQAARFQIFEFPEDGTAPRPARLPQGATVKWSVRLVNKKDAIDRPGGPPDEPTMPTNMPGREHHLIDTGIQTVAGPSAAPVKIQGTYDHETVRLGELRTDAQQRLLMIGAEGKSSSPSGAPIGQSFYTNADWFDDVGDGPVTAEVAMPDGHTVACEPAWVVVAPPDFAPGCQGIVTLYDVMLQVALDQGWTTLPSRPSFTAHIRPMLERARNLKWVNTGAMWPLISDDWTALADASPARKTLRTDNARFVRAAEVQLHDFTLRDWQSHYLDQWVAGDFDPELTPPESTVAGLTRAVLDGAVGQGFFPGIEAGIIVTNPELYAQPFDFRFDHTKVSPGDITALMALPWQADFLKCNGSWWPAQRPDLAQQPDGTRPMWLRPAMNHKRLVSDVMKLGVITPSRDAGGHDVFLETGRDPQLG